MKVRWTAILTAVVGAVLLAGCAPQDQAQFVGVKAQLASGTKLTERDKKMFALAEQTEWSVPIIRREVSDPTGEAPGTIVIFNGMKKLYYVMPGHRAMEYPVAVGAEAFGWTGRATVGHMTEWPTWMPTASIMSRWPEFKVYLQARPARRPLGQPARRPRALSVPRQQGHALSHPRHQRAGGDWPGGVLGLYPHARSRRDRPLQSRPCWHARNRQKLTF